ncbi:MAG: glycoside hydrolase family 127 protein [Armatimonas sp.]
MPVTPERYLTLAEFFIDARGHLEGRSGKDPSFYEYGQDHAPLDKQTTLEGHAVRATLFATGIVSAAQVNHRADYLAAATRFWDSLTKHKLYISGAAGAIEDDEKLGPDYFLPNDGYMETCAAVGVGFFGRNLNLLFGQAGYIDELERALYNAALGGTSLSGDRYYYQNPLIGEGNQRWEWHGCPCCPPMFLKLMGALPGYIYAQDAQAVYVNLFIGSQAQLNVQGTSIALQQSTQYPWEDKVTFTLTHEKPVAFDLLLRLPAWAQPEPANALYRTINAPDTPQASITVNGESVPLELERGYIRLSRIWNPGDMVELTLEMPVRQVVAHPAVEAAQGQVALMRGPILYCVEEVDNPQGLDHLEIAPSATFTPVYRPDLLGGVVTLEGEGITAVPFYASSNREPGALRVWLPARNPA